jgi:phosphatidylglycerol:prolipoprotein diacylglycerol transferase
MLTYPDIDPVALEIGPLKIRWYGLTYLFGFVVAWWLGRRRAAEQGSGWTLQQVDDVIFYSAIGVIVGGRLGSKLFYDLGDWLADPLSLFRIWEGGMSFHGGLLGVIIAMWIFGRRQGKTWGEVADFVSPLVPIGLGAGRIGNFINGELWGKTTELPIGFLVGGEVRHASQLYEAVLEGLVLFVILWLYSARRPPRLAVTGMFLLLYGVFRFLIEFVRLPDAHIGYLTWGWVTMGQVLSLPMILVGGACIGMAYGRKSQQEPRSR